MQKDCAKFMIILGISQKITVLRAVVGNLSIEKEIQKMRQKMEYKIIDIPVIVIAKQQNVTRSIEGARF